MRNHVRTARSDRRSWYDESCEDGAERELALAVLDEGVDDAFEEAGDAVRLSCPDCGRPITVSTADERLPEHALCPTPWNPFGLTVCTGSGRAVSEAPAVQTDAAAEPDLALLLTLPAGLDWRTQPFSHPYTPRHPHAA